ncbi:MAG: hypothetical protein JW900_09540 [Anaerolineae bacterium]|nr:hypothetical protein [Anaerolineae bacterium]
MNELERRTTRAVERMLENEGLTGDLEDAAAKVLIDWSIGSIEAIVRRTVEMDEPQAMEAMFDDLQAVHHLMRRINRWVANRFAMDDAAHAETMAEVFELAGTIYGEPFALPDSFQQEMFLQDMTSDSAEAADVIRQLRGLVEHSSTDEQDLPGSSRVPGGGF